jgi:cytosine/creatinine deaminase
MAESYELVIREARILGMPGDKTFDLAVRDGKISKIAPDLAAKGGEEIEAHGRLILPGFYNMHFHLDSVLKMGDPRYNVSGTLWEGIQIWAEVKNKLSEAEILSRVERAVKWMAAYGTLWLRTHADTTTTNLNTVKALVRGRKELKDLVNIQVTSFPQDGIRTDPGNLELLEKSLELGADNVGMIPHNEWTREDGVKSIEDAFGLAKKYDKDIDGHIDETDDPSSRFLEVVAANAVRRGWVGRVAAGHVTASHSWDAAYRYRISNLIAKAGITIVANPLINMHLQGRLDGYPKRRGMAPIKSFMSSGVNVSLGHDCIMDPWYPLGVGDMLQVLFMAVHVDQIMGQQELADSINLITYNASKAWRNTREYGLDKGKKANFVLANAYTVADAIRTLGPPLYVIKDGSVIAKNLSRMSSEILHNNKWEKIEFIKKE